MATIDSNEKVVLITGYGIYKAYSQSNFKNIILVSICLNFV